MVKSHAISDIQRLEPGFASLAYAEELSRFRARAPLALFHVKQLSQRFGDETAKGKDYLVGTPNPI